MRPWGPSTKEELSRYYNVISPKLFEEHLAIKWKLSILMEIGTVKYERQSSLKKRKYDSTFKRKRKFSNLDSFFNMLKKEMPRHLYYRLLPIGFKSKQEFIFDFDAKDIAKQGFCPAHEGHDGNDAPEWLLEIEPAFHNLPLTRRFLLEKKEQKYAYCYECVNESIRQGFRLQEELKGWGLGSTVWYSGQGCHVHVDLNQNVSKPELYNKTVRQELTKYLIEKKGFPLDSKITVDMNRIFRFPFSLHGGVNQPKVPMIERSFKKSVEKCLKGGITGEL